MSSTWITYVFTWIAEVETVKRQTRATYAKVCDAGLGCGLGCMPALSVKTAPMRWLMRQLWRYIN